MTITDEIKARLDIVDLLSQYINLKKAGRNYTALCPFHAEETPSFVVFPESQTWRCFGSCSVSGDIIDFVMRVEGTVFDNTVRSLAQRVGIDLQGQELELEEQYVDRLDNMLGLMDEAANFFHKKFLHAREAQLARDYAEKRGLSDETISKFRIGFAPNDWHQALDYLTLLGYSEEDIIGASVALRNEESGRVYDRFRNRLVIPICDVHGQVIAFGGRILDPNDTPVYLYSPQTPIFNRSTELFALQNAADTIHMRGAVLAVESPLTAIYLHQSTVENVVATMRIPLSDAQLLALSRHANKLFVVSSHTPESYDYGTIRQTARKLNIDVKFFRIPSGSHDEESFFRDNISTWRAQIIWDSHTAEDEAQSNKALPSDSSQESDKSISSVLLDNLGNEQNVKIVDIQPIDTETRTEHNISEATVEELAATENGFPLDAEAMLNTMARLCAAAGKAREVAILTKSTPKIVETEYDNWNGGTFGYRLYLQVPARLYAEIADAREEAERALLDYSIALLSPYPNHYLQAVHIAPLVALTKEWREKANAWVAGAGISNQGRVRSDNVASRECDGLLFRSQEEINLYKALKALGVSFAPLPVFVRGGETYRRIEPDFLVIKDGIVLVVEVDGDTVHRETPAEAHARLTMLGHEGAHIERVRASECSTLELANSYAKKLLQIIEKHRTLH